MTIADRVQYHIAENALAWDTLPHPPSASCREMARLAHVPAERVAQAVVLKHATGYLAAVIPGDAELDVPRLARALGRDLTLASESELARLFPDCLPGAVPAIATAYGVPTLWATSLGDAPDIYFEGGDQHTLIHMFGMEFSELMRTAGALPPRTFH